MATASGAMNPGEPTLSREIAKARSQDISKSVGNIGGSQMLADIDATFVVDKTRGGDSGMHSTDQVHLLDHRPLDIAAIISTLNQDVL